MFYIKSFLTFQKSLRFIEIQEFMKTAEKYNFVQVCKIFQK